LMNGFTLVKDFPCVEQSFLIFEVDEL
jgi:hypothetical protein